MSALAGKRLLVVEDDFLIGVMIAETLTKAAVHVIGPVGTCDAAMPLAQEQALDGAVLDINLRGETSAPIATALRSRNIPFILATGYGEQPQRAWGEQGLITKPFTDQELLNTLIKVFEIGKDKSELSAARPAAT